MFDLLKDWNPKVGLWRCPGPGHTVETKNLDIIHPCTHSSARMVGAALADRLDQIDVSAVLTALRELQQHDDTEKVGCIRWYWEEKSPYDTNASFFTTVALIPFRKLWGDSLKADDRQLLDEILANFQRWFLREVDTQAAFYPNKFLGDLVCAWMLLEITNQHQSPKAQRVLEVMSQSADYWQQNGWGWGEHMSDAYTVVCLHELSMLLLLAEHLPDDVRSAYRGLMNDLLWIGDAFDNKPRVPAIRGKSRDAAPNCKIFRELIQPWHDEQFSNLSNLPPLGTLWHKLGWHQVAGAKNPPQKDIIIPCYGQSKAVARVESDVRLGTLTRFPVMPAAEQRTWGLSWQSFPAAVLHENGDWGFLQWATVENDIERAHPANGGSMAHIPKCLTSAISRPIVGQTRAIQKAGDAVLLRIMPALFSGWQKVADRFRIISTKAPEHDVIEQNGWSQLLLKYKERTISVAYVDWMSMAAAHNAGTVAPKVNLPKVVSNKFGGFDWQLNYDLARLPEQNQLIGLWAISLNGPIEQSPTIEIRHTCDIPRNPEEKPWQIKWSWPKTPWDLLIDPMAKNELS